MSTDKFIKNLFCELLNSANNNYEDNYDYYRFGELPKVKQIGSVKKAFIGLLNKQGYYNAFNNHLVANQISHLDYALTDYIYLHNNLEDDYSKELLVKIIAYRLLGHKKIKLPLNTSEFWNNQSLIESNQSKDDFIDIRFMNLRLPLTDLNFLNVPLKMYYSALGINIDFIIKQYEFHRELIDIEAGKGDVVIDAGGCFGDTALYFANNVGASGEVHVFEFIPDNIQVFEKNINLNQSLKNNIKLIPNPLWCESGHDVFYFSNGPGSKISMNEFIGYTGKIKTVAIDDYSNMSGLKKIDFIKMDIEGAEIKALYGAKETIKKFKPKLAIALYHSTKDFDIIPRFINELNLGYKFYLSHSTIYGEETMLFADPEK